MRTRFVVCRNITDAQRNAVCRAFAEAQIDARLCARNGRRHSARDYAETCRMLITAFGRELPKDLRRQMGWA
jgi:hypothetical protein